MPNLLLDSNSVSLMRLLQDGYRNWMARKNVKKFTRKNEKNPILYDRLLMEELERSLIIDKWSN